MKRIDSQVESILKRGRMGMDYSLLDQFVPTQKQEDPVDMEGNPAPWTPRVNVATPGFLSLPPEDQSEAIREFEELAAAKKDWFYGVLRDENDKPRVFIAQNETGMFTAMLPSDY